MTEQEKAPESTEQETAAEPVSLTSPKGSRVTVSAEVAENMSKNFYGGSVDPRRSTELDASSLTGQTTVTTMESIEANTATGAKAGNSSIVAPPAGEVETKADAPSLVPEKAPVKATAKARNS